MHWNDPECKKELDFFLEVVRDIWDLLSKIISLLLYYSDEVILY